MLETILVFLCCAGPFSLHRYKTFRDWKNLHLEHQNLTPLEEWIAFRRYTKTGYILATGDYDNEFVTRLKIRSLCILFSGFFVGMLVIFLFQLNW